MKRKQMILVTLLLMLYITPLVFMSSYASATIPTEPHKDFSIAEDWIDDESFHYRKIISIDGGEVATEANYQIRIPVTYNAHMQTDFDDVLFTDNDKVTRLDYWRESYIASTSAVFWVEVADVITKGVEWDGALTYIYMYYGNNTVSTTSNGTATFLLYEDWTSETLGAQWWEKASAGSYSFDDTNAIHGSVLKLDGGTGTATEEIRSLYNVTAPTALVFRAHLEKTVAVSQRVRMGMGSTTDASARAIIMSNEGTQYFYCYDDDANEDNQAMLDADFDDYFVYQITRDGTTGKLYKDNALIETGSIAPDVDEQTSVIMTVRDEEYDLYSDWLFVRKMIIDEPEFDSFGAEEDNFPPSQWNDVGETTVYFHVPFDYWAFDMLLIFLGLGMVILGSLYGAYKIRNDPDMDTVIVVLLLFMFGFALFLGGIGFVGGG